MTETPIVIQPTMQQLPYRTNTTWLSDDELILLDLLFSYELSFKQLCREEFQLRWNLCFSHKLNDDELRCRLRWLCEHGVLETTAECGRQYYRMTAMGDELWSQERCPIWDRFCTTKYKSTSRNRTMTSMIAVSPQIRDDFLRLWPMYPARRRTAAISDYGLLPRRTFPQLYVGIATYAEERRWTNRKSASAYLERYQKHAEELESNRSWWQCVPELQKFLQRRK